MTSSVTIPGRYSASVSPCSLLQKFLMDSLRSFSYVQPVDSTILRTFFGHDRKFNSSISVDQYFGENRIYRATSEKVALSFSLAPSRLLRFAQSLQRQGPVRNTDKRGRRRVPWVPKTPAERSRAYSCMHVTCPIKGNVKKKKLPLGSMPIFFSRHSARPIEAPLREWSCSGAEVVIRLRIRSGETLLPRGSIFATVTAPFVS